MPEETITITLSEAKKLCARLEFDASWDKCGSGYYSMKDQIAKIEKTGRYEEDSE